MGLFTVEVTLSFSFMIRLAIIQDTKHKITNTEAEMYDLHSFHSWNLLFFTIFERKKIKTG